MRAENKPLPAARPVSADAAITSGVDRGWMRGLGWVLGSWVVTAIAWLVTGVDALYAVVVATTALGALGDHPLTARRSLHHLGYTAGLALVGGLVFGARDVGLSLVERLTFGATGVLGASLVLLVITLIRGRAAPIEN